ncbi:MAG: hypothetical protein NTZ98_24405, partial [Acidobacteria bacterium]|nr:hypothetical protein [Acidobacteriota bacterium]
MVCLLLYPLNRVPLRSGEPGGARQIHAPAPAPHPNPAHPNPASPNQAHPNRARPNRARLVGDYGRLPLQFEENRGQTDAQVSFLSRGAGYALFLTRDEAVLQLRRADPGSRNDGDGRPGTPHSALRTPKLGRPATLRMRLVGA